MAEDQALAPERVVQALKAFVTLLSQPEAQPEFRSLQVDLLMHCRQIKLGTLGGSRTISKYVSQMTDHVSSRTTEASCRHTSQPS